jgi:carbonic anhydrase
MGEKQGKLFVHRNVGNVVAPADLNILSVIDFAVNYLKVPHILVVGHYDCGAVRGSLGRPEDGGLGLVENWLRNIRDVARFHKDELMQIQDPEERVRMLVRLNVQEQCLNVLKVGTVQRRRLKNFMKNNFALPRVHGCVFDPKTGILENLPINLRALAKSDSDLYDLYNVPAWLKRNESMDTSTLVNELDRKR